MMREEISEPQHWRSRPSTNPSWSTRRRAAAIALPAELVDAAFTDEGPLTSSRLDAAEVDAEVAAKVDAEVDAEAKTYPKLIAGLTDQLAQLDAQRLRLQKLLAETSCRQS